MISNITTTIDKIIVNTVRAVLLLSHTQSVTSENNQKKSIKNIYIILTVLKALVS